MATKTKAKVINVTKMILNSDLFYKKLNTYQQQILDHYSQRKKLIKFSLNDEEYSCSIANFVTQMVLFIPFVDLKLPIEDINSFIMIDDIKKFNSKTIVNYFNKLIEYAQTLDIKTNEDKFVNQLRPSMKKIINIFAEISGKYNIYSGTTINIKDLLDLYKNDEAFRETFDLKIPDGLDFSDVEKFIANKFSNLMDIIKADKNNCYSPYFNSKTGINVDQFKECISTIGFKADIDGSIIPYPIDTNFLLGLKDVASFYINAILARKSLIISHQKVKDSGYLNRKLSLLVYNVMDIADEDDCGSTEYVNVIMDCKNTAERYNLRYFFNPNTNKLEEFLTNRFEEFEGQTLQFRSPITCKSSNNKICKKCYGDLYKINKNVHIGIIAALELCEPLTQKLLSAKHLQKTVSEVVEWTKNFLNYFIVDKGYIYTDIEKEKSSIKIIIDDEEIEIDEESGAASILSFTLELKNGTEVPLTFPIPLTLTDKIRDFVFTNPIRNNEGKIVVYYKALCDDDNEPIFTYSLNNNELSTTLNAIVELIESANHLGMENIDDLVNKFIELLNEGGIHLAAIHAELLVRQLCREVDDLTRRPTHFDNPDNYKILKVSDGIMNSSNPADSLSFEKLKQIFQGASIYLKDGISILDDIFLQ